MADHEPNTLAFPTREPRPLAIPHVLTPAELAGLLRVGDALADIQERLAAMMARPGGPLTRQLRDLAEACVDMANAVASDPDLEEGGDLEPYLAGSHTDLEGDDADGEPSLGWLLDGRAIGSTLDREEDIADRLHDAEPDELSRQPARLDVALSEEARHA